LSPSDQLPTVTRAIQQAGGLSANANLQQVEIHRTTDSGTEKVIRVNVQKSIESGDYTQDVVLQQDDQVVIPELAPTAQTPTQPETPEASQE
jgi:polysaccharide export outer membrane protein